MAHSHSVPGTPSVRGTERIHRTDSGLQLFDLHTHSRFSDGLASLSQIEQTCERTGLALSLTDHNEVRGSIRLCERQRVPCIPGIEVGTQEGFEFLVYFPCPDRLDRYYREAVEPFLLSRFLVRSRVRSLACLDAARDAGAFVSLAHPFAFGRKSIDYQQAREHIRPGFVRDVLSRIDAIEYFNGGVPPGVNRRAAEFIPTTGKPVTVGSDSHRLRTLGSCGLYLQTDETRDCARLFNTLRAGVVHDRRMKHGSVLLTLPVILWKHTQFFLAKGNHPERKRRRHARHG